MEKKLENTDLNKRVYFELDPEEWHGGGNEGLWAEPLENSKSGDLWRLLNTPFYARGVSFLDIVRAVPRKDEGAGLAFAGVVDRSGHSTYMILIPPHSPQLAFLLEQIAQLGCNYESTGAEHTSFGTRDLIAIDVPPSADVHALYEVLEKGEKKELWLFQEGHCGHPSVVSSESKPQG